MKSVRFFVSVSIVCILSCGGGIESVDELHEKTVSIYAGKGVFIQVSLSSEEFEDSLFFRDEVPVELILSSDNCVSTITAMLVPGCGSSCSDRLIYLADSDVRNPDTSIVSVPGETAYTVVTYVSGDSSVVERVWNRGSGELAVLQVKSGSTSFNILIASVKGTLSTAKLIEPENGLTRSVYLSDRTRTDIVEEVNSDVAVPPVINHRLTLSVNPLEREMNVVDSLTIDFNPTQSDSQMRMFVPSSDNEASFDVTSGSVEYHGDSVLCTADSSRLFRGVYSGDWKGFISSSTGRITADGLQINPSTSFQSGMWFYPGCSIPSVYELDISVPDKGYEVYAPLDEVSRSVFDSLLTVSYVSPIGGIKGPLSWAAGGFTENLIAGGRSRYICLESDSSAIEMIDLADDIAGVLWSNMGFDGARLDIVVVRSLDLPVFITGPGCVFLSTDMLASVGGYETWTDSLADGIAVPATALVFETARVFLAGSTYLSENLGDILAAWSVYKFILSGDEEAAIQLREAFLKYYLYSTGITGGEEYALADPQLNESPLHDPVVFGKAPLVIELLTQEIPAFERAIPRALGNLRHSGDSFYRLFSAMGISDNSEYGEIFFQWLYNAGVPQLEIQWMDSSGTLKIWLKQFQPGQDFPLGSILDEIRVFHETGYTDLDLNHGYTEGYFTADLSGIPDGIKSIDIASDALLPADIVYMRINREPNEL